MSLLKTMNVLVSPDHSAAHLGSGSLEVLATPALVAMMEQVARDYCQTFLPPEETTVGVKIDIEHLAPTKIGRSIQIELISCEQDGRSFSCELQAFDCATLIGRAVHKRVAVNSELFMSKLER